MRNTLKYLIAGGLLLTILLPAGAPAGESGGRSRDGSPALVIDLGIEIDADWISLNGSWRLGERSEDADDSQSRAGGAHELRLGSFPNFVGQAQKGMALFRAVRTTTLCLAKQWIRDRASPGPVPGR